MKRYFLRLRTLREFLWFCCLLWFHQLCPFWDCLLVVRQGLKVAVDYLTSALSEELSSPLNPSPCVLLISTPGRIRGPNFSWNIILQDPHCRNNSSKQVVLGLDNAQPFLNEILKQELTGALWQGRIHIPGIAVGGALEPQTHGSSGMMLPWPRCQQQALAVHSALVGDHTARPRKPARPQDCLGTGLTWIYRTVSCKGYFSAAAPRTKDWRGKLCLKFSVYED